MTPGGPSKGEKMYSIYEVECPNSNCKKKCTAYITDVPIISELYQIECPNCKSKIVFRGEFKIGFDKLPPNAIEATEVMLLD
jgi:DNA-directed RNA polymerase subunit RPC12/RpoP